MTIQALTRTASFLGVLAVVAGLLISNAVASTSDGRAADTLDPAIATAMRAHSTHATTNLRSTDTLDPAVATAMRAHSTHAAADIRATDDLDPAIATAMRATTPQIIVVTNGSFFDWTDAGIGAAGGFAIALLLGGIFVLAQRGRHGGFAL